MKACVLQALADPEELVRSTAGTVITAVVTRGGLKEWPEVLPRLMGLLEHGDVKVVEVGMAFRALARKCGESRAMAS